MSFFPTSRRSSALLLATTFMLTACKADQAVRNSSTLDRSPQPAQTTSVPAPQAPPDPTTTGTVSGVVSFRGTPPARVPIDMSMDPACAFGENQSEQVAVSSGKLTNVYVYLKGVTPSQAPAVHKPVVLDQQACRYTPHVIAVQQGGSVQFSNSDRTVHNVHMVTTVSGNPTVDITENPGGQPEVRQFKTPAQMIPVRCNNHPWMNGFINVADSPYFAVTGADGRFTLAGVPPGSYTLALVQEKLGEQDVPVTVMAQRTASANVTFGK